MTDESEHFDLDQLRALCADPDFASSPSAFALMQHLVSHCPQCWSAVDQLPPLANARCSHIPIVRALERLSDPRTWVLVTSDHLGVLREVRVRPLGFAYLVCEEAHSIGLDGYPPRLELLIQLIEMAVTTSSPHWKLWDVVEYSLWLSCASNEIEMRLIKDAASSEDLVERNRKLLDAADCRVEVRVKLLETRARLAASQQAFSQAREHYLQCLRLLDDEHPLRRFEICAKLAYIECLDEAPPEAIQDTFALASRGLEKLRDIADPILRLNAVHNRARLTAQLVRLATLLGFRLRGAESAAAQLVEAAELYERYANPCTQAVRELYLGQLLAPEDAERAVAAYRRALDALSAERKAALFTQAALGFFELRSRGGLDEVREASETILALDENLLPAKYEVTLKAIVEDELWGDDVVN